MAAALPLLRIGGEHVYRMRESMTTPCPRLCRQHSEPRAGHQLRVRVHAQRSRRRHRTGAAARHGRHTHRTEIVLGRPRPPRLSARPRGPTQEPSFIGIKDAYYGEGRGDWTAVRMKKAQPGDTILVHAGLYRPERLNYVDPLSAPFTGTWSLSLKGTAEKPITIKGAGDGEAIFDGAGNHKLFDVMATQHHIFEGLTFRNTEIAIFAGEKEVMGAVALTVRNCRFEDVGVGVWTENADSRDFFISDNLFLGREDQMRLIGWNQAGQRAPRASTLRTSCEASSPSRSTVPATSSRTTRSPTFTTASASPHTDHRTRIPERRASSIDIYNNDIHLSNDDFIESDGGAHNIRVFQNRGVNAAHNGYSSQPMFGGPVYFFRNILYNVPAGGAFKFNAKPAGILIYHNTLIGEQTARDPYSNAHFRNNLFLGRDTPNAAS